MKGGRYSCVRFSLIIADRIFRMHYASAGEQPAMDRITVKSFRIKINLPLHLVVAT